MVQDGTSASIGIGPDLTDHLRCLFFTTKVPTARHCEAAATLRLALLQSLAREIRVISSAGGDHRKTSCHENQASSKFTCFYCSFEGIRYPMLASKTVELLLKSWPPVWRPKLSLESTCRLILSTKCILRGFKCKALLNSDRKPQEGRLCLLRDRGIHARRAIGLGAWRLRSRWRFSGSFSPVLVAKDLTTNRGFLNWGSPKPWVSIWSIMV